MAFKKIKKEFKDSLRDSAYDGRKVLNPEDVIQVAQFMNYTLDEISGLCGVSKTTVSNWKNINKKDKPTMAQINPLIEEIGAGRVILKVEELPISAIEYPPFYEKLPMAILNLLLIGFVLFIFSDSCIREWESCQKLPWYKMPNYLSLKIRGRTEEFNKWKNDALLIEEFYNWKSDQALIAEFKEWKASKGLSTNTDPQP